MWQRDTTKINLLAISSEEAESSEDSSTLDGDYEITADILEKAHAIIKDMPAKRVFPSPSFHLEILPDTEYDEFTAAEFRAIKNTGASVVDNTGSRIGSQLNVIVGKVYKFVVTLADAVNPGGSPSASGTPSGSVTPTQAAAGQTQGSGGGDDGGLNNSDGSVQGMRKDGNYLTLPRPLSVLKYIPALTAKAGSGQVSNKRIQTNAGSSDGPGKAGRRKRFRVFEMAMFHSSLLFDPVEMDENSVARFHDDMAIIRGRFKLAANVVPRRPRPGTSICTADIMFVVRERNTPHTFHSRMFSINLVSAVTGSDPNQSAAALSSRKIVIRNPVSKQAYLLAKLQNIHMPNYVLRSNIDEKRGVTELVGGIDVGGSEGGGDLYSSDAASSPAGGGGGGEKPRIDTDKSEFLIISCHIVPWSDLARERLMVGEWLRAEVRLPGHVFASLKSISSSRLFVRFTTLLPPLIERSPNTIYLHYTLNSMNSFSSGRNDDPSIHNRNLGGTLAELDIDGFQFDQPRQISLEDPKRLVLRTRLTYNRNDINILTRPVLLSITMSMLYPVISGSDLKNSDMKGSDYNMKRKKWGLCFTLNDISIHLIPDRSRPIAVSNSVTDDEEEDAGKRVEDTGRRVKDVGRRVEVSDMQQKDMIVDEDQSPDRKRRKVQQQPPLTAPAAMPSHESKKKAKGRTGRVSGVSMDRDREMSPTRPPARLTSTSSASKVYQVIPTTIPGLLSYPNSTMVILGHALPSHVYVEIQGVRCEPLQFPHVDSRNSIVFVAPSIISIIQTFHSPNSLSVPNDADQQLSKDEVISKLRNFQDLIFPILVKTCDNYIIPYKSSTNSLQQSCLYVRYICHQESWFKLLQIILL